MSWQNTRLAAVYLAAIFIVGGIKHSEYNGCDEWLYADIFEIDLTDTQKTAVLNAIDRYPDKLRLVTKEEIERLKTDDSVTKNVGNNARWLLGD